MKKLYNISLQVVVDEAKRESALQLARELYTNTAGKSKFDSEANEEYVPASEAVQSVDDALVELIHAHPAFQSQHFELQRITCTAEESAEPFTGLSLEDDLAPLPDRKRAKPPLSAEVIELDEYESGLYVCRWPNGDCSIVSAETRREAVLVLDEFANAHPTQLHPLPSFLADFTLSDEGELILSQFGDETDDAIWKFCYPVLRNVLDAQDSEPEDAQGLKKRRARIRLAVNKERVRLWKNQPRDKASTQAGATIAKRMGMSGTVADRYVDELAQEILESDEGEDGKPN